MNVRDACVITATVSLVAVVAGMMIMFVIAIVDPAVDDGTVFSIVGPAFQTIVGGFIGLITGIKIGENEDESK